MAGSHEVRGSNPLFSTMNSIAGRTIGQRFFISRLEGSNSARFFVRGGFYSTASPRLGPSSWVIGFRARISRLACTLSGHLVFCATFLERG